MDQVFVIDTIQKMVWFIILLSAPILVVSMVVGLGISMLQAVTQIQESTLTFVPKILAALLVLVVSSPWYIGLMADYTTDMLKQLETIALTKR